MNTTGIGRLLRRLRALVRKGALEREMAEEIRLHVELETEELVRAGMHRDEARRRALVAFGGVERVKEDARDVRGLPWLEDLAQDVRYALRGLARTPGFTVAVVVTLALAIGANATMFGIVDRLLLRGPEHVRDAGQLRRVYWHFTSGRMAGISTRLNRGSPYVTYTDLRAGVAGISGAAAYGSGTLWSGRGAETRSVRAKYATWDFFPLLGVQPALGRFFQADEDRPPQGERVVVLDHDYWRRQFGADPGVIGRQIELGGLSHTVVGIAPPLFTGVDLGPVDVWLPESIQRPGTSWPTMRGSQWLSILVRLAPGVAPELANSAADLTHRRAAAGTPYEATQLQLLPISRDAAGNERPEAAVSRWLAGVAAVVLLVACANVANLLLARATRRRREVAVRLALGAGRMRLVRMLLAEGVLLAMAGGVAAVAVAYWGGPLLRATLLPNVAFAWSVDARVLVFTALVALGTGVLAGLVPALEASRPDLSASLKAGSREGGAGRSRLPASLVVAQSALAFVLLVGAALFAQSLRRVKSLDLGVESSRFLVTSISWPNHFLSGLTPEQKDQERARRRAFFVQALDRLQAQPWVEHASLDIGTASLENTMKAKLLRVPGLDSLPPRQANVSAVSPDFFATVGTPLMRGRLFTPADREGAERVAIMGETLARALWPGRDAVGQCLVVFDEEFGCARVVGVVKDVIQWELREEPEFRYYVPLGQDVGLWWETLYVRPRGDHPERAVEQVRRELLAVDPNSPLPDIRLMEADLAGQVRPWRLGASLFGLFGLLALLVTVVGLYSVIAYVVEQRTREYGVRIALGASPGAVFGQTLRRGLAPAALGLPVGIVIALLVGRFLGPLLFETSPRDLGVFALVALTLLAVSVLASLVPAIRATRVDPVVALQAE